MRVVIQKMEEEEGFEPPRDLTPLSVFKTDPFSQTWVFLRVGQDIIYHVFKNPSTVLKEKMIFFIKIHKTGNFMWLAWLFYRDFNFMFDFSSSTPYTSKCRARWEGSGVL